MWYMEVLKKHVDNFLPGRRIPKCLLSAVADEDKKTPPLQYQVKLIGAKEPFNIMAIELPSISGISYYDNSVSLYSNHNVYHSI